MEILPTFQLEVRKMRRAEDIKHTVALLAFDPKDTSYCRSCWIWPKSVDKNGRPFMRLRYHTGNPQRALVEHVNGPIPANPYTTKDAYTLRSCALNRSCVNPYHARTHRMNDGWFLDLPYEQKHFLFPDELEATLDQWGGDQYGAPLNFLPEYKEPQFTCSSPPSKPQPQSTSSASVSS